MLEIISKQVRVLVYQLWLWRFDGKDKSFTCCFNQGLF